MKLPHYTLPLLLAVHSAWACPYLRAQQQAQRESKDAIRVVSHDVVAATYHHDHVHRGLQQVSFFRLVDSTTSEILADPLVDGAIIPVPSPDVSVNVEAIVSGSGVGSVVFDNGRKEGVAPYARCGDVSGVFFDCWDLGVGSNTVSAMVLSSSDGSTGPETTITFTLQVGGDPTPTPTAISAPTLAPVTSPTAAPMPAPTAFPFPAPTFAPMSPPTFAPTTAPTFAPVTAPTLAPVAAPTSAPVPAPTLAPVSSPTFAPTSASTSAPITAPTLTPTPAPTSAPVLAPTSAPTSTPTSAPVIAPTLTPTRAPTSAPTSTPTSGPTSTPTSAPVIAPTLTPTRAPTLAPVPAPTSAPTSNSAAKTRWFVNLGGSTTFRDENSQNWQPDIDLFQTGSAVDECPGFIGFPTSELFCSRRTWPSSTSGVLELPVPPSATYEITLFFSETTANPGERIMDIVLEGQSLFSLDIAEQVGGSFGAFSVNFNGPIFDGAVSIELRSVRGDPTLAAIRIIDPNAATSSPISVPSQPTVPVSSPTSAPIAPTPSLAERIAAVPAAKRDISRIMTGTLAAQLLRLSFHDCVGGCDGCVNLNNPDNAGLREPIEALAGISNKFADVLTRADIWVLAGMTAAESSLPSGTNLQFNTEFLGRPVCTEDNPFGGPRRELPGPHLTSDELTDFFQQNFGFSSRDTVAIMGAHTMGRARPQNSGFNGEAGWSLTPNVLDNGFYRALLSRRLESVFSQERQRTNGQIMWRRNTNGTPLFMLNADMALVVDLSRSINLSTGGTVSCRLDFCPQSPLRGFTDLYFNNENAWLLDFREAFIKMTNRGCENGSCLVLP